MLPKFVHRLFLLLLLASLVAGCNLPNPQDWLIQQSPAQETAAPEAPKLSTPQPPLPKTIVTFFVEVPILDPVVPDNGLPIEPAGEPTPEVLESPSETPTAEPADAQPAPATEPVEEDLESEETELEEGQSEPGIEQTIFFTILDEVTGLALNSQSQQMQLVPSDVITSTPGTQLYVISVPLEIGSVVKYHYERQTDSYRVAEHLLDGSPIRYRLFYVQSPGEVRDVVSRWTDTQNEQGLGRIRGTITDAVSGAPIPNLLVIAGGAQATTMADGSYLINGLAPGTHNLVVYARDGAYQTFQQGALVAADSMTPADIQLQPSTFVKVIFVVSLPKETPPIIPVRLAGNLYQLGNTFASLDGGISSLTVNMPELSILPDGRYSVTLDLPVGADIRYKYTLGDGFWNAEHSATGEYRLRQLVVPNQNIVVEDTVETWMAGNANTITFDVTVPQDTPADDFVAIQFNPVFGWTEPLPMWSLGENRWAYILFSPLNLPGNFSYRYCRSGQCGSADDERTPGQYGAGRPLELLDRPQQISDQVTGWIDLTGQQPVELQSAAPTARESGFWAGIQLQNAYRPSWKTRLPASMAHIQQVGANWVVLTPTWTFGRNAPGNEPPSLEPSPERDMLWFDMQAFAEQGNGYNLQMALYPSPSFFINQDEWWLEAARDDAWWDVWFDEYRSLILHHAVFAEQNQLPALIIGGGWLSPALPGGMLADGSDAAAPMDAETRWRSLIDEVRSAYSGQLLWALPVEQLAQPPFLLELVDAVYVEFSFSDEVLASLANLEFNLATRIDDQFNTLITPYHEQSGKPVVVAFAYPSLNSLADQAEAYQIFLTAVENRPWVTGFVSQGYYPPAALLDRSSSLHGKPAGEVLSVWFKGWIGGE